MNLFYRRIGRNAEWDEKYAKTEFLYYIFQDYITTKQKNISEIDDFVDEMADVNEEREFSKEGFDNTKFDATNQKVLNEIKTSKIKDLNVSGNKGEVFNQALEYVGDFTIEEAAKKLNLKKKLNITSDFDIEVYAKKGWKDREYLAYFDKVFDAMKKTEKKEKNTETKKFTLNENSVKGNLTKIGKLQDAGFQYITKESIPEGKGYTGMGDMIYSRNRAVTRNFGTVEQGILDMGELATFYSQKVVPSKRKIEGTGSKGLKWEYETADLQYVIQRLLYYAGEFKDAKGKATAKGLKLPRLDAEAQRAGAERSRKRKEGEKVGPLDDKFKIDVDPSMIFSVISKKRNIKLVQDIFDDLEKIVELGQKGKKLTKTDLEKIHEDIAKVQEDMEKIYPENFNYPAYAQPKEEEDKRAKYGFNGYAYVFNAASRKLAKKYGSRYEKQLAELESKASPSVIKNFKERQFELYNGSVNHFLAWAAKGLDVIVLGYIEAIQEYGRQVLAQLEEAAGIRFKQNLKAKEAWENPEDWLKRELTGALNDLQHLYIIELELTKTTVNDNTSYRVKKWSIKPKFDLMPSKIERYTSMNVKLGGGSYLDDSQMGATRRPRESVKTDEQVGYKIQKEVVKFAKMIKRRFNELRSVI